MKIYANNGQMPINQTPKSGGGFFNAPVLNYGFNSLFPMQNEFDSIQLPPAIAGSVVIAFFLDGIFTPNNVVAIFPNQNTSGDVINGGGNQQSEWDFPTTIMDEFPESQPLLVCVCYFDGTWFVSGQEGEGP